MLSRLKKSSHKRSALTRSRRENREVHKDHKSMMWPCQLRDKVGIAWQSAPGQTLEVAEGKGARDNGGLERFFSQPCSSIPRAVFLLEKWSWKLHPDHDVQGCGFVKSLFRSVYGFGLCHLLGQRVPVVIMHRINWYARAAARPVHWAGALNSCSQSLSHARPFQCPPALCSV